jgi:hypothetical protein
MVSFLFSQLDADNEDTTQRMVEEEKVRNLDP